MGFRRLPEDACARASAKGSIDRTSRAAGALVRDVPQDVGICARLGANGGGDLI